jgi:hypothetical protein
VNGDGAHAFFSVEWNAGGHYYVAPEIIRPTAPTGLAATSVPAGIRITWQAVTGARSYTISRATLRTRYARIGSTTRTSFTDRHKDRTNLPLHRASVEWRQRERLQPPHHNPAPLRQNASSDPVRCHRPQLASARCGRNTSIQGSDAGLWVPRIRFACKSAGPVLRPQPEDPGGTEFLKPLSLSGSPCRRRTRPGGSRAR